MYSIQTLYLGNSPAWGVKRTIERLAYNSIPLDEIKSENKRFLQNNINENNKRIANAGL